MYDFHQDRYGGVTLYRDRSDFCYLQPGDDANSFLTTVEGILKIPEKHGENSSEKLLESLIYEYDI